MATLHELARNSRHKANNNFLLSYRDYFAIKEGSKQISREGDDANVIYRLERSVMFRSSYSTLFIHYFSDA